ncbi:MAG: glycosyltransferase family 2 protein [Steroidobacteraceae bacterium]
MAASEFEVSVIIPNYNYQDYVGAAIDSALALDWPKVQIIVVDDGSSDHSREVIERYRGRVDILYREHAGQIQADNAGFARSSGEVVIFLDADDLVEPALIRELAAVWRAGVSKVQFQMRIIDAAGDPLGSVLPQYYRVPGPEQIRDWNRRSGTYPTPPGSGNAYAREFLQRIFPLDPAIDQAADSFCLSAAPLLGDVLTVAKPLVSYRIHGRNLGAMAELEPTRFSRQVARALRRFSYASGVAAAAGCPMDPCAFDRALSVLPARLVSLRLATATHPIAGDTRRRVLGCVLRAIWIPQGFSPLGRATLLLWALLVASAPLTWCERLVRWRFIPAARPRLLRQVLGWLRIARRPG